jgi:multiple sugar transport system substrate-binding protein
MISDAGATVPDNNWTWNDVEVIGAKLKGSGKMLAGQIDIRNFFDFYVRSTGGNLFSPDGSGLGYSDDKVFIDYFTRLKKIYDAGYMLSLDKLAQKKDVIEQDEMVLGNAASYFTWSNLYVAGSDLTKRPLDILPPPGPDNKKSIFLMSSQGLSVAKNSKNKEEAVKFVNWMINDIEANKIIKGERGVPISSKVQEAIKPLLKPEEQRMMDFVSWVGKNAVSNRPIDPIGAVEAEKLLKDLSQQILFKKISVEEAAAKFRTEANAIFKRNKK